MNFDDIFGEGSGSDAGNFMRQFFGEGKKALFGDPEAIKAAYEKAMGDARAGGKDITNFLMGQQGKAQQYYAPLANLFQSTYGTQGIQAPQIPQASNPGTLSSLYGGR